MPGSSAQRRACRAPRDVDELIRELQDINLSQCLYQLHSDIGQLGQMDRQLGSWTGLYVRCPGPEPDDLGCDLADKKSSSGYSTESASPPESRDISDEAVGACAEEPAEVYAETEVKHRLSDDEGQDESETQFSADASCVAGRGVSSAGDRRYPRSLHALPSPPRRPRMPAYLPPPGLAGFCPAAASTPTQRAETPCSPKTLRFAATAELIPSNSAPRLRAMAAAPRHGILRKARIGAAPPQGDHVNDSRRARLQTAASSQLRRQGSDRVKLAVSALKRLEADHSGVSPGGSACGTPQFVSSRPRRAASVPASPVHTPLEPLVLVTSSDDVIHDNPAPADEPISSGGVRSDGRAAAAVQLPAMSDSSQHDLVRWRHVKVAPLRPARRRFAWLLSCTSRRRPPSPSPAARISTPPDLGGRPSPASVLYQCNLCGLKFQEHRQVVAHVHERHQRVHVRPKYSCGLCPARFYASRFLAKHCAHHHMGMGDKRTPQCLKMRRIV